MTATMAGWLDGDNASGRMKAEGRADGIWTAQQKGVDEERSRAANVRSSSAPDMLEGQS